MTIVTSQITSSYNFTLELQDENTLTYKVVVKDSQDTEIYNNENYETNTQVTVSSTSAGVYTIEVYEWLEDAWELIEGGNITILEYKIYVEWYWLPPTTGNSFSAFEEGQTYSYSPDGFILYNNACPVPPLYPSQINFKQYHLINQVWEEVENSEVTNSLDGYDEAPDYSLVTFEFTFTGYPTKIVTTVSNCNEQLINDTYVDQEYLMTAVDATNQHSELQGMSSYDVTFNYKYGNQNGDYPQLVITPENSSYTTCTLYLYKNNVLIHSYPNLTPDVYYPYSFAEASKPGVVYKVAYVSTNGTYTYTQEVPITVEEYKPEFTLPTIQCKKINENATIALDGLRFNCFANDRNFHPQNPDFDPTINYKIFYLNPNTYTWEPKTGTLEDYTGVTVNVQSSVDDFIDTYPNTSDSAIGNYLEDEFAYGKSAVEMWTPNKLTMVKMVVTVTNYSTSVMKETIFPICGTWKIRRMSCGKYRIYNYTENEISFNIEKSNNGTFVSLKSIKVGALSFESFDLPEDGIYKVDGGGLTKYVFNFCELENCILELQKKILLDDELCDACKLDKVLYQKALRILPVYETWKKLLDRDWVYEIQYQSTDVAGSLVAIYDAEELYAELKDLCDNCDYSSEKCKCK